MMMEGDLTVTLLKNRTAVGVSGTDEFESYHLRPVVKLLSL